MIITLPRAIWVAALVLVTVSTLVPQQVAKTQRIPQFENQEVNVWKTTVLPNAPLTMHTHQHPRVVVALRGGTMKITTEHGVSEMHVWETGKSYWLSGEQGRKRHVDINAGAQPIEVMVVELKNAQ